MRPPMSPAAHTMLNPCTPSFAMRMCHVHQVAPEAAAALLARGATLLPLPLPPPLLAQLRAESAAVLERGGAASQAAKKAKGAV